jgi:hypothetical protein
MRETETLRVLGKAGGKPSVRATLFVYGQCGLDKAPAVLTHGEVVVNLIQTASSC